jgi:selenium metabolism protein YedF
MKTVDAKGLKCPMPLILTKRALMEIDQDEMLEILIDNETSVKNVTRFLEEHGMETSLKNQDGIYRLTVSKTGIITEQTRTEEYCEIPREDAGDYLISFQKSIQGEGSDEMGTRLIQLFINTLPDIDYKPGALIFLNSCIFLTLKDSPVLEPLKKLEDAGVKILVCGTCLDVFQKKDELAVGIVSNMYEIMTLMSKAPKVLYP